MQAAISSTSNTASPIEAESRRISQAIATQAVPPAKASASPDAIESSQAHVRQAIEAANVALKQVTSDLVFAVDSATGKTVVRIIDSQTQEIVRQFPSEALLAIARAFDRIQNAQNAQKA